MKLYHTPTSPYVRKVMVCAIELGLESRIETIFLRPTPLKADPQLSKANPLSKIPALILDDGSALYDSPVICEYLESLVHGSDEGGAKSSAARLVPSARRWEILRLQALCDGILDAGVLAFYETLNRPVDKQWDEAVRGQAEKAQQGLSALEREVGALEAGSPNLASICAGATIGWLNLRGSVGEVLVGRPKLSAWYEVFRQRPSMVRTEPKA